MGSPNVEFRWRGMMFEGEITTLKENDTVLFDRVSRTLMFSRRGTPLRFENEAGCPDDKRSLSFISSESDFQALAILLAEIHNLPIVLFGDFNQNETIWRVDFIRAGG